jgi:hypothetical protein
MAGIDLDRFTGGFSGGARPNLFEVEIVNAPIMDTSVSKAMKILCQGASLPAATFGEIIVPYMGRQLKIPGNRTYDTWDLTIINDEDFRIRKHFHQWQEGMNDPRSNKNRFDDKTSFGQFRVNQLNGSGKVIQRYNIHNAWPSVVSDIELNWESNDALETFTVTLNFSHWTMNAQSEHGGDEGDSAGNRSTLESFSDAVARGRDIAQGTGSFLSGAGEMLRSLGG